jgi:hypothetical protein
MPSSPFDDAVALFTALKSEEGLIFDPTAAIPSTNSPLYEIMKEAAVAALEKQRFSATPTEAGGASLRGDSTPQRRLQNGSYFSGLHYDSTSLHLLLNAGLSESEFVACVSEEFDVFLYYQLRRYLTRLSGEALAAFFEDCSTYKDIVIPNSRAKWYVRCLWMRIFRAPFPLLCSSSNSTASAASDSSATFPVSFALSAFALCTGPAQSSQAWKPSAGPARCWPA